MDARSIPMQERRFAETARRVPITIFSSASKMDGGAYALKNAPTLRVYVFIRGSHSFSKHQDVFT